MTQECNKTANINVKKLQFIHKLTASDTSKTAKIAKRWYYSAAHWHLGDVLMGNHLFVIFAVLDVSLAVNLCINCSFLHLSVIRLILEYCSAVWHHSLTKAQAESLEAIQRRALRIIDSSTVSMPHEVALSLTQFASLHNCREHLGKKFFSSITLPFSCIFGLLLPPRDFSITSRWCTPSLVPPTCNSH